MDTNHRIRPNAARRHDPVELDDHRNSEKHFISDTHLEWTSLNYRKEKTASLSPSRKRMVLMMFQKQYAYFPTLKEIKDELSLGQIHNIHSERKYWKLNSDFNYLKAEYTNNWTLLFQLADLDLDMEKPLTPSVLSNPNHRAVKLIMYIYSMESFVYDDLNRVCRQKDKSKIKFYGAYAAALSFIIHSANQNRDKKKLQKVTTLFRGLKLTQEIIEQLRPGTTTNLLGYTSTSLSFKTALEFALEVKKN